MPLARGKRLGYGINEPLWRLLFSKAGALVGGVILALGLHAGIENAAEFTAEAGNMAKMGLLVGDVIWIYEEYEIPSDATKLGTGILYKGKVVSMYAGGQQANNAQTGAFSVNLVGDSVYIAFQGETTSYVDLFNGESVTTPA